jgi:hypothetical protein
MRLNNAIMKSTEDKFDLNELGIRLIRKTWAKWLKRGVKDRYHGDGH